jgi:hypothetical protein
MKLQGQCAIRLVKWRKWPLLLQRRTAPRGSYQGVWHALALQQKGEAQRLHPYKPYSLLRGLPALGPGGAALCPNPSAVGDGRGVGVVPRSKRGV